MNLQAIILIALLCSTGFICEEKTGKSCECGITMGGGEGHRTLRIVNGDIVSTPSKYPWMVAIFKGAKHICGGVIISGFYVLTAAHCAVKQSCIDNPKEWYECYLSPDQLRVSLVSNTAGSGTDHSVKSVIGHPKFTTQSVSYDIALLKMEEKMDCTTLSVPICLPTSSGLDGSGVVGTVAGWGRSLSGQFHISPPKLLRKSEMEIRSDCGKGLEKFTTHFCARSWNQNTCWGDSGGPFIVELEGRNYVVGISSFGTDIHCSNHVEFFTRVSDVLPWIRKETRLKRRMNQSRSRKKKSGNYQY